MRSSIQRKTQTPSNVYDIDFNIQFQVLSKSIKPGGRLTEQQPNSLIRASNGQNQQLNHVNNAHIVNSFFSPENEQTEKNQTNLLLFQ